MNSPDSKKRFGRIERKYYSATGAIWLSLILVLSGCMDAAANATRTFEAHMDDSCTLHEGVGEVVVESAAVRQHKATKFTVPEDPTGTIDHYILFIGNQDGTTNHVEQKVAPGSSYTATGQYTNLLNYQVCYVSDITQPSLGAH